jgi:serine/threonine protein kinase
MSLAPGIQIGRYEIISLLGSGGMGEVYLAKDNQFPRQVAVKVLTKAGDEERLRRFRQEARMVSALNHPNILSVYEFGEHDDLYFIATELVKGKTLRHVITEGQLKLRDAVEIAIQIGNALAFAHEAGIIHRDIKPENIMILPDGYVKVLDFGLAKLNEIEKTFPSDQRDSTVSLIHTKPGLIVGTINYMSPEQLRNQEADARADIWSLGVVLFEMASGYRPFTGESVSDVIAGILTHPLPSTGEVSAELEGILERAICKEREGRYQHAKEFTDDLRVFRELLSRDTNLVSRQLENNGSEKRNKPLPIREKSKTRAVVLLIVFPLLFFVIGGWLYLNRTTAPPQSPQKTRTAITLSTTGSVLNAVLSPEGTRYAYVQEKDGMQSLRVRQVNGGGESTLVPPADIVYRGIQFSPDRKSIFYVAFGPETTGELFSISAIGGDSPQKITEDLDSPVAFSPDGKQFAFIRTMSHEGLDQIRISNVDGSNQQVLSERTHPLRYSVSQDVRESLAWSPDGKSIACAASVKDDKDGRMTVVEIDIATRSERPFTPLTWFRVGKVLWTGDGQDLIITAADFGNAPYHITRLSRATGQIVERITTELNDYLNISLSADSKSLMAVADVRSASLYVAPSENPDAATQIAGGNLQGIGGLAWTPDGRVLYVSTGNGNRDIWSAGSAGENPRSLTSDPAADESPSTDGKYISFLSLRSGSPHVWLMNADGSDPRQLTDDNGSENFPQITQDGGLVFYTAKPLKIWKVSTESKEAAALSNIPANWIAVSPDGSMVAGITRDDKGKFSLVIFSSTDGREIKTFDLLKGFGSPRLTPLFRWRPDGKAIGYISTENGVSNIVLQSLSGGPPNKFTNFSTDNIFAFDWSKDGRKIAISRGRVENNLILFKDGD